MGTVCPDCGDGLPEDTLCGYDEATVKTCDHCPVVIDISEPPGSPAHLNAICIDNMPDFKEFGHVCDLCFEKWHAMY